MTALVLAPSDRLLVLAPHPDDEVLGAGAAILAARDRGAHVHVAFATDGEGNAWVQRLLERRLRLREADRARFGRRRRLEGLAALAVLGVPESEVEFLDLPDTRLAASLAAGDDRVRASVPDLLLRVAPTVLVGPSPRDLHPDHGALGVVVRGLLRAGETPASLRTVLEFCVHGDDAPCAASRAVVVAPSPRALRAALARHTAPMSVHRRAFEVRVARPLRLARLDPAGPRDAPHPLLAGERTGSAVRLVVRGPRGGGWTRGRRLVLLRCPRVGPWAAMVVPLDASRSRGPSEDSWTSVRRARGRVAVEVPAGGNDDSTWFAKVERRVGFYDAAGWLELGRSSGTRAPVEVRAPDSLRTVAVVPCYDVAGLCGPVVAAVARRCDRVLAVDDGSTDATADVLARCAAVAPDRVHVFRCPQNRGKGAVLLAAFQHALDAGPFDAVVTIDGDGQHRPEDVPRVLAACAAGADLAIGGREGYDLMPLRSRIGNTLTSLWIRRLFPRCPADTQSGLRAHSPALVRRVLAEASAGRYETETQILLIALSAGLRVVSVPIPTVYIDRNRSSHFRPLRDGARVYVAVARWWWRRHLRGVRAHKQPAPRVADAARPPRSFGVPKRERPGPTRRVLRRRTG